MEYENKKMTAGPDTVTPGESTGSAYEAVIDFFGIAPSPLRPVLFFLPIDIGVFYFCYMRGMTMIVMITAFASGFLVWTLAEYLFHRFLFHSRPTHPLMRQLVDYLHVRHHKEPFKLPSVVLPLWLMIVFSVAAVPLLWPLLQDFELALLVYTGFGVGYLVYETTHYIMHMALLKSERWPGWAASHLCHHFVNARNNFGISSSFWDRLFFTYQKPPTGFPARV